MHSRWLLFTAMAGGALSAGAGDVQLFGIHIPTLGKWAVYARISNDFTANPSAGIAKVTGLSSISINVLNNGGNTVTSVQNMLPVGATTEPPLVLNPQDPPGQQIIEEVRYGFSQGHGARLTALGAENIEGAQNTAYGQVRSTTYDNFVIQGAGVKKGSQAVDLPNGFAEAQSWFYPLTVATGTYTPGATPQTGLIINYPTARGASVLRDADANPDVTTWFGPGNTENASNTIVIDPRYHTGALGGTATGGIWGTTFSVREGDINLDGHVDLVDLILLANNYGRQATFFGGDIDLNGEVDLVDLIRLANNYGTSASMDLPAPGTVSPQFAQDMAYAFSLVPEPSGLLVVGLGVLGGLCRRKARQCPVKTLARKNLLAGSR